MTAICALTHSVLQNGMHRSGTRYTSSTAKFVPFARVERVKPSDGNNLQMAFNLDSNPNKLNLSGDFYRNADGKPYVFQAVHKAKLAVVSMTGCPMSHSYHLAIPSLIELPTNSSLAKQLPQ